MASKNDGNWLAKFELLKAHVAETGHFPDKHCMLNHFCKYTRRKINEGKLEEWKKEMFEELAASRRLNEHTGGRRKKE